MALLDQYDGVIFDYGGVLVHHQTEEDQAALAAIARIPTQTFTELYWADRLEYDKDQSRADYWRAVARAAAVEFTSKQIDELTEADSVSWMHYDPVMWEWLDEIRVRGKRVAILSNMPRDLGEALKSRTKLLDRFDFVTLSYELRSAKPDAPIYHHSIKGIGTTPARTLFLDDRIVNVRAAEALGIQAIQFTSREDVLPLLRGTA